MENENKGKNKLTHRYKNAKEEKIMAKMFLYLGRRKILCF